MQVREYDGKEKGPLTDKRKGILRVIGRYNVTQRLLFVVVYNELEERKGVLDMDVYK